MLLLQSPDRNANGRATDEHGDRRSARGEVDGADTNELEPRKEKQVSTLDSRLSGGSKSLMKMKRPSVCPPRSTSSHWDHLAARSPLRLLLLLYRRRKTRLRVQSRARYRGGTERRYRPWYPAMWRSSTCETKMKSERDS